MTPTKRQLALGLNDRQKQFILFYIKNGGNASQAALQAGYATKDSGNDQLNNPLVLNELRRMQERHINGELTTKALGTLESIMTGAAYPPAARVQACKIVLDMGGYGTQAQALKHKTGDESRAKPLDEMTQAELAAFIAAQKQAIESLEDVSRHVHAPEIDVTRSVSMNTTALVGQMSIKEGGSSVTLEAEPVEHPKPALLPPSPEAG